MGIALACPDVGSASGVCWSLVLSSDAGPDPSLLKLKLNSGRWFGVRAMSVKNKLKLANWVVKLRDIFCRDQVEASRLRLSGVKLRLTAVNLTSASKDVVHGMRWSETKWSIYLPQCRHDTGSGSCRFLERDMVSDAANIEKTKGLI